MKRFSGKIAMVTGSSRGLGKAIALELALGGATLIMHATKKSSEAEKTFKQIQEISLKSKLYYADFTNPDEIAKMTLLIQKNFTHIDILVNNAGVQLSKVLQKITDDEWNTVMDVNINGTYYITKLLLRSIIKRGNGRIVNMSSIYGLIGEYGLTSYCTSKAAIIGFTKALSKEVSKYNITVNAICPGFTNAGMANNIQQKLLNKNIRSIPLQRVGKKEEVAKLVAFLCSDDAAYITGQIISINGGLF